MVTDMRSPQSPSEQAHKSRGERADNSPSVTQTAQWHAAARLASGFTLDQLVAEYRALRATVTRQWRDESGVTTAKELDQLIRFNEALDQSLTEAIRWFDHGLARSRDLFIGMLVACTN